MLDISFVGFERFTTRSPVGLSKALEPFMCDLTRAATLQESEEVIIRVKWN